METVSDCESRTSRWLVRGLVAGPALPSGRVKLGGLCRIRSITDNESRKLKRQAGLRYFNEDFDDSRVGCPVVVSTEMLVSRVFSRHELSVVVEAPDSYLALDVAEEARRQLGALALAVGAQRYRFVASFAEKRPGPGGWDEQKHISSPEGPLNLYRSGKLRPDQIEYAKKLLALSNKRKVDKAFGFMRNAWRLGDVPLLDPTIHRAILLNCYLVLETASNDVTKDWRGANRADTLKKQGSIVDELATKLAGTKNLSGRIAGVEDAYKRLQRANRYYQDLKIETAGRLMGVEDTFVELAIELGKLRNRQLGHTGSAEGGELLEWVYENDDSRSISQGSNFGKGELAAMAYLKAYLAYVDTA